MIMPMPRELRQRSRALNRWDSVEAVVGILHLPNPPQSVQRAVVEVEGGVAGRGSRIAARVNAVDVVTCSVNLFSGYQLQSVYHAG